VILNNFFRRTLTGAYIVIFILGGFWLHPVSFFLAGLVVLAGTQYEYYLMIRKTGVKPQLLPGMVTGVTAYVLSTLVASGQITWNYFLILIPMMLVIMIAELYRKQEKPFDSIAHTLFSVLYSGIPLSLFPFSAFSSSGLETLLPHNLGNFSPGIIIGFFLLIWANDTGAYLVGVTIGRHKLFERISPKKSWEGFIGGIVLAVAAGWFLAGWLGVVDRFRWVIIALIVSVAGTYGDLIESMLKRNTGVKDSGTIMPGHGGFLDRFDSAIFSFPFVYLFISLFG
jgi:phosphatidate cytidylyltransferase